MANICVFCGARDGSQPLYRELATKIGNSIASRGHNLIYGGGNRGLMGAVASGVRENGGKVIGVMPRFLEQKERDETVLYESDELVYIETMDERKTILYGRADIIITLPGGCGTMDEFFEVLTLRQLSQHEKPIGILNISGYYDPLISYLHHMVEEGFVSVTDMDLIIVRDEVEDLLDSLGA